MAKEWYTIAEVSERYGVKLHTVYGWIKAGKLHAVRLGGKLYRVSEEALEEFEKEGVA